MNRRQARAKLTLASLQRWTERLRAYAPVWDSPDFDVRERQAFPLEWHDVMDRFRSLVELADRGALQPSDMVDLRARADELTELLPTMQRLRLRQPDPDVLQRARIAEAV